MKTINTEDIISKIINIEEAIYFSQHDHQMNYLDYCILSYYLYEFFKNSDKNELSVKYFNRGRMKLKEFLINLSHISFFDTWYGAVGLLYIMRSFNINNDLNKKISYFEEKTLITVKSFIKEDNFKLERFHYDIFNGLVGISLYLMKYNYEKNEEILKEISYRLIEILSVFNSEISDKLPIMKPKMEKPKKIDYGIAHGILGIIFCLSKYYTYSKDIHILEAINISLKCYKKFIYSDLYTHIDKFPTMAEVDENDNYKYYHVNRSVWCYGSIGTYRALYLISININDIKFKQLIEAEIIKFKNNTPKDFHLVCPTFCHGLSGVYYILSLFNNDNYNFGNITKKLENEIWTFYDDNLKFCFPKYDLIKGGNIKKYVTELLLWME